MDPLKVREYLSRDWTEVAESKLAYWAEQFRAHGPGPAWEASNVLFADVRLVQPAFPTAADRARDLAAHARLCELMSRAVDAVPGRSAAR